MANIFTNFLNNVGQGMSLTGDQTNFKDYQHANRLYIQNFYRLAPKHSHLYFVRFILSPSIANQEVWAQTRQDLEVGMLVKKADLPKITFDTQTVNSYNKKIPIVTKVNHLPVSMTLHDDNAGIVRRFWQSYYMYYSADGWYGGDNVKPGSTPFYNFNRYSKNQGIKNPQLNSRSNQNSPYYQSTQDPARFGLDTGRTENFIRAIEIYQFSRKQFFLHTLINPVIKTWNMDTVDQVAGKLMEHNVTFEYEGVYFGKGKVRKSTPDGWTELHYDLDPSPIGGIFGRGDGSLLGPYGLMADGTDLFADLQDMKDGNITNGEALASALKGLRLIQNANKLNTTAAEQEVRDALEKNLAIETIRFLGGSQAVSGLTTNRLDTTSVNTTVATQRAITSGTAVPTSTAQPTVTSNSSTTLPTTRTLIDLQKQRVTTIILESPFTEDLGFVQYAKGVGLNEATTRAELLSLEQNYKRLTPAARRGYQVAYATELTATLNTDTDAQELGKISNQQIVNTFNLITEPISDLRDLLTDGQITEAEEAKLLATYVKLKTVETIYTLIPN